MSGILEWRRALVEGGQHDKCVSINIERKRAPRDLACVRAALTSLAPLLCGGGQKVVRPWTLLISCTFLRFEIQGGLACSSLGGWSLNDRSIARRRAASSIEAKPVIQDAGMNTVSSYPHLNPARIDFGTSSQNLLVSCSVVVSALCFSSLTASQQSFVVCCVARPPRTSHVLCRATRHVPEHKPVRKTAAAGTAPLDHILLILWSILQHADFPTLISSTGSSL